MPNTRAKVNRDFIREAAQWESISEVADEWGVPERFVRGAVERRKVEAIKLDMIRINPDSWVWFMENSYRPTENLACEPRISS